MNTNPQARLVIHGGAGVMPDHDYSEPAGFMHEILPEAGERLRSGEAALEDRELYEHIALGVIKPVPGLCEYGANTAMAFRHIAHRGR